MPSFGPESEKQLATCHPDIQRVLRESIKHVNFSVTCGHRGQEAQDKAFAEGKSKLKWPQGKHNKQPAQAVDVAPYPLDWNDGEAFTFLNGFICGVAASMGVNWRSGVIWDGPIKVKGIGFCDRPHVEIRI